MRYLIFSILCLSLLYSCDNEYDKIISQSEKLIEKSPDSVLFLLEKIPFKDNLPEEDYYNYILLKAEARKSLDRNILDDTLLIKAKNYYILKNDYVKAAKSALLCGSMHYQQNRQEYHIALKEYLDAEAYAKHTSNNILKSDIQFAIGEIYKKNEYSMREALNHYFEAYSYIKDSEYIKKELSVLQAIGTIYLHLQKDSSFIYFEKAELLSNKLSDGQLSNLNGLGIAYFQIQDYKKAIEYEHKAISFAKNKNDSLKIRFNIAQSYNHANILDSARSQFRLLLNEVQGKDEFYEMNIYASLSNIEEKEGNYRESLDFLRKYNSLLKHVRSSNDIYDIKEVENKYNFQLIINEKKQLIIEKQRIMLYSLVATLIIILIALYFYHKSQVNKKLLFDANETINQLDKMAQNYNEKESSFRTVLLQHFNILKKVALIDGYLNSDEKKQGEKYLNKINSIVYGQNELDWHLLYKTMNELHNSFFDRLKEKYPELDENEFKICCLSYAGFTNTEMAIIMKLSINTVQMKRSSIRKKIGITEAGGNIEEFLRQNITV